MKFHHITARVSDIQRVTGWYREVLGFEVRATGTALNGAMQFAHLHVPGFDVSFVQHGGVPASGRVGMRVLVVCRVVSHRALTS